MTRFEAAEGPADPGARRSPPVPGPATAPRVFLVDDDERLREIIRELLTDAGAKVVGEAGSGAAAVALIPPATATAPAVVLMDVRMPGTLNGIEVTRHLAASGARVKVVIFTGFAEPGIEQAARDAGAVGFLQKGVKGDVIVAAVGSAWAGLLAAR